jgi:thioredoxin-dependent peroxiredoxin
MQQPNNERKGVVTFKGGALTLLGSAIKEGDSAPDFTVLNQDLAQVKLASAKGKVLIISSVPSVDTPVCDAQTRRFNQEASKLGNKVEVWTISMDLPFAQKRFCAAAGIDRVFLLSDYKEASFGLAFGCLIKELRLLARAVFVLDKTGKVAHSEYVPEVTTHPNYEAALSAAKKLI